MTNFEQIKNKTIDELAEWISQYCYIDGAPWMNWWNNTYCAKCDGEVGFVKECNREMEFAYCEIHDKCRFFPELEEAPDLTDIIEMWLETEAKE